MPVWFDVEAQAEERCSLPHPIDSLLLSLIVFVNEYSYSPDSYARVLFKSTRAISTQYVHYLYIYKLYDNTRNTAQTDNAVEEIPAVFVLVDEWTMTMRFGT